MKKKLFLFIFFIICISSSFSQLFEFAKHELRLFWSDAAFLGALSNTFEPPIKFRNQYNGVAGAFNADYTYDLYKRVAFGGGLGYVRNYRNEPLDDAILNQNSYQKIFYDNIYIHFLVKFTYFKTEFIKLYGACSVGMGITFNNTGYVSAFPTVQITGFGTRIGTDEFGFFVEVGAGTTGIVSAGLLVNIY
ncbi:MAG: hypothetical protein ACRC5H_03550 [Treponemataceae bacterium]